MIVPTKSDNDKTTLFENESGHLSADAALKMGVPSPMPSPKHKNLFPRRVLLGGIWIGTLALFARDLTVLPSQEREAEASLPSEPPPPVVPPKVPVSQLPSPFTHYAEQTQITAMVGEPMICAVVTDVSPTYKSLAYLHGYSVSVIALSSGKEVPYTPDYPSYKYRGHMVDRTKYYTLNRTFNLTKPGLYRIDFHLNTPWKIPSAQDIADQQDYLEATRAWYAVGPKGNDPLPKMPESNTAFIPHEATFSIKLRILPPSTIALRQSALRQAQQLGQLLVDYGIGKNTSEIGRETEAFWCYPDTILLPIAREEFLPFKRKLEIAASEHCPDGTELSRSAVDARFAIRALIFRMHCPPLSQQRLAFLNWLTEDIRYGKNDALRRHVETDLKDLL